ncbi:Hypothetical protein, putative [Bodo saltans]|uniref:Membrane-associated protein n=1 Tax=Bodo saltans TaxID=75058 RepID=A0A0S4JPI0_BODSA|nr:Hypothetical protein, putative [Bodo saltans]|eukprot:CUG91185.1 Hypothetical protein, putative [Bodo saltans]
MSALNTLHCVLVVVLAFAVRESLAQTQLKYAAGMGPNAPLGYTIASLHDLQTAEFSAQYNSVGLNFIQPFPAGVVCCVVSVAEGFLSIGPSDASSNYIEPFLNGVDTCTSNTQPYSTTFGVPNFSPGPYEGMWISDLTTKEQAALRVTGVAPTLCAVNSTVTPVVYKYTPQYEIRPYGPNYPAPNASEFTFASLADVQSADFQASYNATGGIYFTGSNNTNYCCLIRVANGGWLSYSATPKATAYSPLSLYTQDTNSWACNLQSNDQIHSLGTSFGGPTPDTVFDTLNASTTALFGTFVNNTQNWDGCGSNLPDSLTVFKRVTLPQYIVQIVGTGAAPIPANYAVASITDLQSVEFQNFYNAAGGLQMSAAVAPEFCCIVQVAEGAVGYNLANGISPVSVYSDNVVECATGMGAAQVFLGTAFGGPNSGTIYPTLNSTVTSLFGTFSLSSSTFCSGYTTSQTLLKLVA